MTTVEFHVFAEAPELKSLHYVCRLIENKYSKQSTLYIHTNSLKEAERLDMLLWTYKDDSFLPHDIFATENENIAIQIGYGDFHPQAIKKNDTALINLSNVLFPFYQQFNSIIEIVFSDPNRQQLARERFKKYRDQGYDIQTYKIKLTTYDIYR